MSDVREKLIDLPLIDKEWLASTWRGWRNGMMAGVRIRLPYIFHAAIYAVVFRDPGSINRLRLVIKQLFWHGRNLGMFVCIYKAICFILRRAGVRGGIESWIAGFVGGYYGFGESKGISGSVNNQIVLYLFARGIESALLILVDKGILPEWAHIQKGTGFRCFAGFSLALILYMTDYQNHLLRKGFQDVMHNLYYESNERNSALLPPSNFAPFVLLIFVSYLSTWIPAVDLDNVLSSVVDA